ncbi:MAG: ROK family protein [Planctomycetaceae bacterium]|nr:ROK family protein [Planctomycetales bacterium]MCB9926788.1 ROK family protein [Planctomycetaceae bacterium]
MFLGIEIGGTKLQLGVGAGDGGKFVDFERRDIDISQGAPGILAQIEEVGQKLVAEHRVERIGIGFGGPVNSKTGCVITSHQVAGWDDVPLVSWCEQKLGVPVVIGNDCDCAALAEALYGAGQGSRTVFYVTVGTGIGGGLVINGVLQGEGRPAVAEIGHLRPGLSADTPAATVESYAAGPGIVAAAERLLGTSEDTAAKNELRHCKLESVVTAKLLAELAQSGNSIAISAIFQSTCVLGWAIGQVITVTAADVVVVGGGVSLIGEERFFQPLRREVARYVFPPLAASYQILPAALGEEVVVHGALALVSRLRN